MESWYLAFVAHSFLCEISLFGSSVLEISIC